MIMSYVTAKTSLKYTRCFSSHLHNCFGIFILFILFMKVVFMCNMSCIIKQWYLWWHEGLPVATYNA